MTFRISLGVGLTCLLAAGGARAQTLYLTPATPEVSIGYQSLPSKAPGLSQGGIQLSEGSIAHVGVGAELGYDSNVFYANTGAQSSAVARVVPFAEITNATRGGASATDIFYDLGAALTYREYLTTDADIKQQRAFMPSAFGTLDFGRIQSVGFGVSDSFMRTEDPPYVASDQPITRDSNLFMASARLSPGGGRISLSLRYTNTLDLFETTSLRYANQMAHALIFDGSWKWLPKTALVLQVTQGYASYFNTQNGVGKPTSYPLHVLGGLRGLITSKLVASLLLGYANGFYQTSREGTSGLGNFSVAADLTLRPTVLTTLTGGYRRDFLNSIVGDFYYLDTVYLSFGQSIAGRVGMGLSARYESRDVRNIQFTNGTLANRRDGVLTVGANIDYHMRDWTYAGVAYTLAASNTTNYSPAPGPNDPPPLDYVKHMVFARVGVTY